MANIKLSKSQKVTIAGVTFFSAIILGGLNTTNVSATTENQSTTNQVVGQTDTGSTSSGTDSNTGNAPADAGSDKGANTSGQIDSGTDTGSVVSGTEGGTGAAGTDETTNSGLNKDNSEISGNENISAYSAEPVSTATTEVPVADSQGNTIDWNNRSEYNSSANSGIIINYKIQGTDGQETGSLKDQRGQMFIVGNENDVVDLTKSLPQGYTFVNDADRKQIIGKAYDGINAQNYIDSITKTIYVVRSEGSTSQFIPSIFQLKYEGASFPIMYFGYLKENVDVGKAINASVPIGFLKDISTPPSGVLVDNFSFNGMNSSVKTVEAFKDNQTKMSNQVNFNLGGKTLSSMTTDQIQLGNSTTVTAPEGYTFSDGSTTKTITIGAASPMYLAYYSTLGITDIDPSIHDLDIVKTPGLISDKEVNLEAKEGVVWNPSEAYDSTNSTDENGNPIGFDKLTSVVIQKVGSSTPETGTTIDQSKPGKYIVTYSYNGATTTTTVNITQTPVINSKPSYSINLDSSNSWRPENTYISGTDENGDSLNITDLTVTIDGVTSDAAPTTPGDYTVVYSYAYGENQIATSTTILHFTQNPKLILRFNFFKIGTTINASEILNFTKSYDENNHLIDRNNRDVTYTIDGVVYHDGENYTVTKFGYTEGIVSYLNVTAKGPNVIGYQDPIINAQNKDVLVGDNITASDLFDTSTDEFDSPLSIDKIKITIDGNEVKKDTAIDTSKPGKHTIIYNYNYMSGVDNDKTEPMPIYSNYNKTVTVTVSSNPTTEPTIPTTPSADKEWAINAPYLVKTDDYAQIYSSPSTFNPVSTRKLAHDTDWMVGLAVQNSEGTFYQVSTNEWVKAGDMWAFKPIADVVYANDPDNTEVFSTVDANKDTNINLSYQTAWLVDRVAVDSDGNTWYRVGTSNYVKSTDVTKMAPETAYNGSVELAGTGDVPLYNLDYYGHVKKASRKASSGTTWISNNHRELNGTMYHQISNSEWVSEIDSVFTKQN